MMLSSTLLLTKKMIIYGPCAWCTYEIHNVYDINGSWQSIILWEGYVQDKTRSKYIVSKTSSRVMLDIAQYSDSTLDL